MVFTSTASLVVAGLAGIVAAVCAMIRRPMLTRGIKIILAVGISLLALAAGEPVWRSRAVEHVTVMVDLSPSTRGAGFRERSMLRHRLGELLGDTAANVVFFSDHNQFDRDQQGLLEGDGELGDMPCEQTRFAPPEDEAIVLFSDGRFALPEKSPPVYAVLDPELENVTDAAVTGMQFVGANVAVDVRNHGGPRVLSIRGREGGTTEVVTEAVTEDQTFLRRAGGEVTARLSGGDLWPENDALSIREPVGMDSELWWMGAGCPAGWRAMTQLPGEAAEYLGAGTIVLNNVSADEVTAVGQERLEEYVRDLGGSLILCGGNRAFGAGEYDGTVLGNLSPLSSAAPQPVNLWMLLVDASGSMGQSGRWSVASRAVVDLLGRLPPNDRVRVGQFSDSLRWWSEDRSVAETKGLELPPADARPHGATNLEPVLEAIARGTWGGEPVQLLLVTDADVAIDDPGGLGRALKGAGVHLHVMAIERGRGIGALEEIARETGGSVSVQEDANEWGRAARELMLSARLDPLGEKAMSVRFVGEAAGVEGASVSPWDRTWVKPGATAVAMGNDGETTETTIGATWRVGLGRVTALGFAAQARQVTGVARVFAEAPRDPRVRVAWRMGATARVTVDAGDEKEFLNGLDFRLEIWEPESGGVRSEPIIQTAPGRYEGLVAGLRQPAIATIFLGGRAMDRTALPGWYAPEFAAIGEDREALEALARQSGGGVILPSQRKPIRFVGRTRERRLTSWLAGLGGAMVALGLMVWKRAD